MHERNPIEIIKEAGEKAAGKTSWTVTRRVLRPQVEGVENFAILKKHLAQGGSGLIYANDPLEKRSVPATAIAIEEYLTSINHLVVFVSRRQVDSSLGRANKIQHFLLMNIWAKSPGVIMIPIVQEKDRERYPDWEEFNAGAEKQMNECAHTSGNVSVITPGGERTPQLREAKIGFAALFRDTKEIAKAMPVAVPYRARTIIAGAPISWEDSLKDQERNPEMRLKHRLMARLALILPPEERGFYAQMALDFKMPPINP